MWPHEFVFTSEGQPAAYKSLSIMAFVTGFLTIMVNQPDALRRKMSAHLTKIMEDGETFGWPVVRAYHTFFVTELRTEPSHVG